MASVTKYETDSGVKWEVRFRGPDHRTTRKRGFTTKKDAQRWADHLGVSLSAGGYVATSAGRANVARLGAEWLQRQAHLKPSSARVVGSAWRTHVKPKWGEVQVGKIRRSQVQSWVAELSSRRGPVTVTRAFGVLAAILDDAVADQLIATNPARGVKLPKRKRAEQVYLTAPQLHALADHAKDRRALVLLLGFGGLRFAEAAALRVRHLDLLRRRIHIRENAVTVGGRVEVGTPKNHAARTVAITRLVAQELSQQCVGKGRDDLVFPSARGGYMLLPSNTKSWWSGAIDRAQRDDPEFPRAGVHMLRHTAASLMISAGATVKAIQTQLGHQSATLTLDRYGHLFPDDLGDLVDALERSASKSRPETSEGPDSATGTGP